MEALDDDGSPCPPGHMGRLVVTLLNNYATPLIRYETGDYGELSPPCPCGRELPVLKRIVGRIRNLVVLPGGEKISPVFKDDQLLAIAPLRQYQLTQKTRQEIEVTLAVERPLTEDEENSLGDYFTEHFRRAFDYRFVYVKKFPARPPESSKSSAPRSPTHRLALMTPRKGMDDSRGNRWFSVRTPFPR